MRNENALTGRRVLVVEDETRLRDMPQRAVRDMGFEITCAGIAESGMRILEDRPIDILLVDLNLPGMGGLRCWRSCIAAGRIAGDCADGIWRSAKRQNAMHMEWLIS